jgi:hypothetical protein
METTRQIDDRKESRPHNTRLAQWGLTLLNETLCFYCKFVLVDNLVFQNPPLCQAWERCVQPYTNGFLV